MTWFIDLYAEYKPASWELQKNITLLAGLYFAHRPLNGDIYNTKVTMLHAILGHNSCNKKWSVDVVPSEQHQNKLEKAQKANDGKHNYM